MKTARHPNKHRRPTSDSMYFARAAFEANNGRKPQNVKELAKFMVRVQNTESEKQSAIPKVSDCFGSAESLKYPPPIDSVIAGRLRESLSIGGELMAACTQRGILSQALSDSLGMAIFLASMFPRARAAQSHTGVPASVLIAESYELCCGATNVYGNDMFQTGRQFESVMDSFYDRAYALKNTAEFGAVLDASVQPSGQLSFIPRVDDARYLEEVQRWSDKAHKDAGFNVAETIALFGLAECDRLHLAI